VCGRQTILEMLWAKPDWLHSAQSLVYVHLDGVRPRQQFIQRKLHKPRGQDRPASAAAERGRSVANGLLRHRPGWGPTRPYGAVECNHKSGVNGMGHDGSGRGLRDWLTRA
jgi:hypothetical protein